MNGISRSPRLPDEREEDMNQNKLVAIFRQVLAEHENGALGGIDLAEALAQAVSTSPPKPEQLEAAFGYIDKTIDNCQDLPDDLEWGNSEVMEMIADIRAELVAAAGAAPQEQRERVEARLREVVYLCGDDIGCHCEEARYGAEALARELSIVAAGEPTLTASRVWELARALHDEAGDSDNVAAFAESLTASLRVAGIPFDEVDFVDQGLLVKAELADAEPQEPTSERCGHCGDKLDYVAGLGGNGCYSHCWRCWYKDHPVDIPGQVYEAKLYEVIDTAQRVWNSSGRHEPMAAAITRAVLNEISGER